MTMILASVALWLAALPPQNIRPGVPVDPISVGRSERPVIASYAETSLVAFVDGGPGGSQNLYLSRSDGRGLDWEPPLRVDGDLTGATKILQPWSLFILEDRVYLAWEDQRDGGQAELYWNRSLDGGQTWLGEQRIDKGSAAGSGAVIDWRMIVSPGNTNDHIYFLLSVDPTGAANERLLLLSSNDAGASLFGPVPVSSLSPGASDVDDIAIAARGEVAHVAWLDDRNGGGNDVWYQRTGDRGQSWQITDLQLDSSAPGTGNASGEPSIFFDSQEVAVLWPERLGASTEDELRFAFSTTNGFSFRIDTRVGNYMPGADDVDAPKIAIAGPLLLAFWHDDRTGRDEVYRAVSLDRGFTWTEERLSSRGGQDPRLSVTLEDATPYVLGVAWRSLAPIPAMEIAFSRDLGLRWNSGVVVSDNLVAIETPDIALNQSYGNLLACWVENGRARVGGFRAASLYPRGSPFSAGQAVHFELEHFPASDAGFRFQVLVAMAPGSAKFPGDGRRLGLANDRFLSTSAQLGVLSGTVLADGSGSTTSFNFPAAARVPPGTQLHMIAVSRQGKSLASITDIVVETVF